MCYAAINRQLEQYPYTHTNKQCLKYICWKGYSLMVLAEQLQHGLNFRKRTPESDYMGSNPGTALNCDVTSGKVLTLCLSLFICQMRITQVPATQACSEDEIN